LWASKCQDIACLVCKLLDYFEDNEITLRLMIFLKILFLSGDAMNTSARMMSTGDEQCIHIST
jgi:hypothetical protein